MESIKKFKAYLDKRFQKHPIAGYIIYGGLMGFVSSLCVILLVLGVLAITGIYGRLSIDYRTWRIYIIIAAVVAVIVFVIGAMAFFPYKRKGNSLFKKEYTKGTSYKALHSLLVKQSDEKE